MTIQDIILEQSLLEWICPNLSNSQTLHNYADNVIPDVVWASHERLATLLDEAGHLTAAPELIVEVLFPGADNQRRDCDLKLRLYSVRGVREYWIIDRQAQQIEVYRRQKTALSLVETLFADNGRAMAVRTIQGLLNPCGTHIRLRCLMGMAKFHIARWTPGHAEQ